MTRLQAAGRPTPLNRALEAVDRTRATYDKCIAQAEQARVAYRKAMAQATDAGVTYAALGRRLGVSAARVAQVITGRK
jgi:hypothetical protein